MDYIAQFRVMKPGIEPATPGLQGELHNHCTTEASTFKRALKNYSSPYLVCNDRMAFFHVL